MPALDVKILLLYNLIIHPMQLSVYTESVHAIFPNVCRFYMSMEAGAEAQPSGETAVSESEAQHITLAQVPSLIS